MSMEIIEIPKKKEDKIKLSLSKSSSLVEVRLASAGWGLNVQMAHKGAGISTSMVLIDLWWWRSWGGRWEEVQGGSVWIDSESPHKHMHTHTLRHNEH